MVEVVAATAVALFTPEHMKGHWGKVTALFDSTDRIKLCFEMGHRQETSVGIVLNPEDVFTCIRYHDLRRYHGHIVKEIMNFFLDYVLPGYTNYFWSYWYATKQQGLQFINGENFLLDNLIYFLQTPAVPKEYSDYINFQKLVEEADAWAALG